MPSKRFQKKQPVPDIITLLNFLFKEKKEQANVAIP